MTNAYVIDFTYTEKPFNDMTLHRMCIVADSYSQAVVKGTIELDNMVNTNFPINTELVAKYEDVII